MENKKLLQSILEKADDMIGDVAYGQASKIEGVEIEDGKVTGDIGQRHLEALLDSFEDIMGEAAYGVFRESIREVYKEDSTVKNVDLPNKAVPKEVRAEKFASAL